MHTLNIKKIVNKKKTAAIINDILRLANASIAIKDNDGNLIFGERPNDPLCKHSPVHISGEVVCWLAGKKEIESIFPLISYIITGEIERGRLADETLQKYKELNMFYNLSEKIATSIDFKELSSFILEEARSMIKCTDGGIFLVKKENNDISLIDFFGETGFQQTIADFCRIKENKKVFLSMAEIVNDMRTDTRFQKIFTSTTSMIFSPIKIQQEPLGLICLATKDHGSLYFARDLKLIQALSLQAATVFNNEKLRN